VGMVVGTTSHFRLGGNALEMKLGLHGLKDGLHGFEMGLHTQRKPKLVLNCGGDFNLTHRCVYKGEMSLQHCHCVWRALKFRSKCRDRKSIHGRGRKALVSIVLSPCLGRFLCEEG
jgi:hypothetical protein